MRRWHSRLAAAGAIVALSGAVALAVLASHPPALLRVGAGYAAKMVCSSVFLEGRAAERALREDVQAPGSMLLKLVRVSVDREQGIVRAGFLGFIGDGLAVAQPGLGCRVVPDGDLRRVMHSGRAMRSPRSIRPQPWPEGEVVVPDAKLSGLIADDALTGPGTRAVVVVHRRRIVAERYADGFDADTRQLGWSMTKTVTATLIGMLVESGRLHIEEPTGLWPAGDPRAAIRIADLMSMTSGLEFNEAYGVVSDATRMLFLEPDAAAFAARQPLGHPPGTAWSYSSGSAVLLARVFQNAAGTGALDLVRLGFFQRIGMQSAVLETDARGTLIGSSYLYATPRDWARFGELLLEQGSWQGMPVLPPGYVERMRTPVGASGGEYGGGMVWLWGSEAAPAAPHVNPDRAFDLPPDTFWMSGYEGQFIALVPSRAALIVRLGLTPPREHYRPQPLVQAVLRALPP